MLTPGGFATMGFGPSAAIGAKLAAPDRTVVSLVGDGGFGQNPAMLATAVEHDLGIVWVVMNNNAYGTIAGLQLAHFGLTYGTTFPGDGADPELLPELRRGRRAPTAPTGIRIESAADFRPALEKALAIGPAGGARRGDEEQPDARPPGTGTSSTSTRRASGARTSPPTEGADMARDITAEEQSPRRRHGRPGRGPPWPRSPTTTSTRVDRLAQAIGWALGNETTFTRLAHMSVDESGIGDRDGRVAKRFKIHGILRDALRTPSVGIIEERRRTRGSSSTPSRPG